MQKLEIKLASFWSEIREKELENLVIMGDKMHGDVLFDEFRQVVKILFVFLWQNYPTDASPFRSNQLKYMDLNYSIFYNFIGHFLLF